METYTFPQMHILQYPGAPYKINVYDTFIPILQVLEQFYCFKLLQKLTVIYQLLLPTFSSIYNLLVVSLVRNTIPNNKNVSTSKDSNTFLGWVRREELSRMTMFPGQYYLVSGILGQSLNSDFLLFIIQHVPTSPAPLLRSQY